MLQEIFNYDFIHLSILGLLGIVFHYLKKAREAGLSGKKFSLRKEYLGVILSVISTITLVYLREDIKELYVVTNFGAIGLGFVGHSFFFSILDTKKPKVSDDD